MTTMRFFVIGSWTEGMFHFQKLKNFIVAYEAAVIEAKTYRLPVGYPVLVNAEGLTDVGHVEGLLVELKHDETLLALMDTMHGVNPIDQSKGISFRQKHVVKKRCGTLELVDVYFLNPKKLTAKCIEIKDGSWRQMLHENPPLTDQLTEKQKTYVLKLGSIKGRDIVPINDLALYRELMKMELIVDKGRRLALSNLGKEVYNYLV